MADVNNNTKRRGRPRGSKNKNKLSPKDKNIISPHNHTLESLRDKKKRSLSRDARQTSESTASSLGGPSKKVPSSRLPTSHGNSSVQGNTVPTTPSTSDSFSPVPPASQTSSSGLGPSLGSSNTDSLPVPPSSTGPPLSQDAGAILQQLVNRFSGVEDKLSKLDSMERKLNKLDGIEAKTNSINSQIQGIQSSVDSLDSEVTSIKTSVRSNEEKMEQEIAALKEKLNSQEVSFQSAVNGLKNETKSHFNGFTHHIESAFIKEQAANRKMNLIFTGVPEGGGYSDSRLLRDILRVGLGLNDIHVDAAFRMDGQRANSLRSRPLMVRFAFLADRRRVWQAKKRLQQGEYNYIWIQEDMPRELKEDLRILLRVAKRAEATQKDEYRDLRVRDFRIHLAGKSYHPSDLESLPTELRPSTLCTRRSDEAIIFFGRYSPLSNHHCSPFNLEGISYTSVEHFLAVKRATLAGNQDLLDEALSHTNPSDSKATLNLLKDDHVQEWEESRSSLLLSALRCKFSQNSLLGTYLRVTYPLYLGEASRDPVWGIGFGLSEKVVPPYSTWIKDGNLLGCSLSKVRGELIHELGLP